MVFLVTIGGLTFFDRGHFFSLRSRRKHKAWGVTQEVSGKRKEPVVTGDSRKLMLNCHKIKDRNYAIKTGAAAARLHGLVSLCNVLPGALHPRLYAYICSVGSR